VQHCISELESLAIAPNRLNELNDAYEMEDLVDNIKLALYKEYKSDEVTTNNNNLMNRPIATKVLTENQGMCISRQINIQGLPTKSCLIIIASKAISKPY
jgi:hypothetical protein